MPQDMNAIVCTTHNTFIPCPHKNKDCKLSAEHEDFDKALATQAGEGK